MYGINSLDGESKLEIGINANHVSWLFSFCVILISLKPSLFLSVCLEQSP